MTTRKLNNNLLIHMLNSLPTIPDERYFFLIVIQNRLIKKKNKLNMVLYSLRFFSKNNNSAFISFLLIGSLD